MDKSRMTDTSKASQSVGANPRYVVRYGSNGGQLAVNKEYDPKRCCACGSRLTCFNRGKNGLCKACVAIRQY